MNTESIRINFCLYLCLLSSFRKMSHHKAQCHVDLSAVTSSPCVFRLCLAPRVDLALLYLNLSRWQWWRHSRHTQTHKHFILPQAWVQSRMYPLRPIGQSMSRECMEDKEICPRPWNKEKQREHPLSTICLPVSRMFYSSTDSRQTQKELLPWALFFSQTKGNRNYLKTTMLPTGHENPKRTVLLRSTRSERMVLK